MRPVASNIHTHEGERIARTHGRVRSRRRRHALRAATAAAVMVACAAVPVQAAVADTSNDATSGSGSAWASVLDALRPIRPLDPHRVIVRFSDPSVADLGRSGGVPGSSTLQARSQRVRQAQDARLAALSAAGISFTVEHRYTLTTNGVSIVVHGDAMQALRGVEGVRTVSQVRSIWPAAVSSGSTGEPATGTPAGVDASGHHRATVGILDTAIDFNNPLLSSAQAGPGYDVIARQPGVDSGEDADHGTQVAGGVLTGAARGSVGIVPIRVLESVPVLGGAEAVVGRSDSLIAGLERAVDPDGNGVPDDSLDVALIASTAPYASFAGSAFDDAVSGAAVFGTVVVAAAGNDGPGSGGNGTLGGPASASEALAVGAADLRDSVPVADVHIRGGMLDSVKPSAPVITTLRALPEDKLPLIAIDGADDDPVAYLDDNARSKVAGGVALVRRRSDVLIADQIRAAADAGAVAVLVSGADDQSVAATVDGAGIDIPAVGLDTATADQIRSVATNGSVSVTFDGRTIAADSRNGTVAPFSSTGPSIGGSRGIDVVAPGVGVLTTSTGTSSKGAGATTRTSGTSIAAAQAAGAAATVRARFPGMSAAGVRGVVIGSSHPLGREGHRDSASAQGAGLVDALRIAQDRDHTLGVLASPARIDAGVIAAGGSSAPVALTFLRSDGSPHAGQPVLLAETPDSGGPQPRLTSDGVRIDVPQGADAGTYGGWIIDRDSGVRIPWTAVVGDPNHLPPVRAAVDDPVIEPAARRDEYPTKLHVSIGSDRSGGASVEGAAAIRVVLVDASGKEHGEIGRVDEALTGLYDFGISGLGSDGKPLAAGTWTVRVDAVPATFASAVSSGSTASSGTSPALTWSTAGQATFTIATDAAPPAT